MSFETKIIKTREYRRTFYGIASMILFLIATFVVFIIPELIGKDYLNDWFGSYAKLISLVFALLYLNGATLMIISTTNKTLGVIKISDNSIDIQKIDNNKVTSITDIDTIHLTYCRTGKSWKIFSNGNQNYIQIVDKQKQLYLYEFVINTKQDKLNLIESLQTLKNSGVYVRVDFKPERFYDDNDFNELRKITYKA